MTDPAQCARPAPSRDSPLPLAVTQLSWLAPSAEALAALAAAPSAETWPAVRHDPGAVLLLLRCSGGDEPFPFPHAAVHCPAALELARRLLDGPPTGWVDPSPTFTAVLTACRALARTAHDLAARGGRVEPVRAWCAGLLAPLGWLGVCAADPTAATACLADPDLGHDPAATQTRHWETDHAALARRLARHWELPGWLTAVVGRLDLRPDHAERFGAEPALAAIVRLAIGLLRETGIELGLAGPLTDADEAAASLRRVDLEPAPFRPELVAAADPYRQPLLAQLLAVGAENRRLRQQSRLDGLEAEADALHALLREQVDGEAVRLRQAKLAALAEFAAGAGHEINNPLAVISGQAQYLLGHADWFAAAPDGAVPRALETVVGQTRRIHAILRDLMLFARPTPPRPTAVDLPTLLGEVAAGLGELAAQRQVSVEVGVRPERLAVPADGEQLRTALTCLVRNALEAAPAGGWARLQIAEAAGGAVDVLVEDSGAGPTAEQRPHLFDPFYSGRQAGRGRGLGLPIAWRLARNHGGDLWLEPARSGAPTRFVLRLPRQTPEPSGGGDQADLYLRRIA